MKLYKYLFLISFFSCNDDVSHGKYKEISNNEIVDYVRGEELLIGKFSSYMVGRDAFGISLPGLTNEQSTSFAIGNRTFESSFAESNGLGPLFNSKSCGTCHFRDGRGKPLIDIGEEVSTGFLMRISQANDPVTGAIPHPIYGDQIQDRGINQSFRVAKEASLQVSFELIKGKYANGDSYELRKPIYKIIDCKLEDVSGIKMSPRVGNQTIGLGFIDAMSEFEILKNVDEFDKDGDGISGRANYVYNISENKNTIGKFGWKANSPTLAQQVAGALNGDIGITTSMMPNHNISLKQEDVAKYFKEIGYAGAVELSDDKFNDLLFYQATLSVPVRRNFKSKEVLEGKRLFSKLACIKCHTTDMYVDKSQIIPLINGTTIHPYSDFLLHDMGKLLSDNRSDFLANGSEWRTQPLWGIGLIKDVNKHTNLLHDGRARNIEEAILWHGGEAQRSKDSFIKLSKTNRRALLAFVNSL